MFNWIIRKCASHWSYDGKITKLNILTYHRVGESYSAKNPKSIYWDLFKQQIKWLNKYFTVLPLPLALELQARNELPPRAVCITIDDGYRDSYDFIYKTLLDEGITGAFFISTQGLIKGGLWDEEIYAAIFNAPDEVTELYLQGKLFDISSFEKRVDVRYQLVESTKYLPLKQREAAVESIKQQTQFNKTIDKFLSAEQIKEMHASGMTIGAHTHSHPILNKESNSVALLEIKQSKEILENIIEQQVEFFAYPNGKYEQDFNAQHVEMVKSLGFKAAFSTDWGILSDQKSEGYKIKRFTPWDETELRFALRLALNYRKK
ncbi:polysaccharide deacetylase family protein [Litorilituus lipolyticus]|uniref:polysaccharide deacetylase family protein n=1 Tax=Litorilituus lipolyticus TaxID=2491017 RepID=UPI001478A0B1|nr:polysaccharide deacetylase family protein [Litorilituus lipolyticus]